MATKKATITLSEEEVRLNLEIMNALLRGGDTSVLIRRDAARTLHRKLKARADHFAEAKRLEILGCPPDP